MTDISPSPSPPAGPESSWDRDRAIDALVEAQSEVRRVVVGQERMLERLFTCLLANGHVLLEGVPGVGKTVTLAALANVVGGTFNRIQFTADLMPSDIVGTRVYRSSAETFDVETGPVFANFVLADEINRAPAKVQSAMLEVMAEKQVTIGGKTIKLPDPFMVLATQNPLESEGVYPLPDAQRDRFLMRVVVSFPTPDEEAGILSRMERRSPVAAQVLTPEAIVTLQKIAQDVEVPAEIADYAVRIILATRNPAAHGLSGLEGIIQQGTSSRATIGMIRAARALALLRDRETVTCQDVYDIAYDVLNHRLPLTYDALADGITADEVLVALLSTVPAPV